MSLALQAAIAVMVLGAPVAGRAAAAFIAANLDDEASLEKAPFTSADGGAGKETDLSGSRYRATPARYFTAAVQTAFLAAALWASLVMQQELILPSILLGWFLIVLFVFDIAAFVLPDVLSYTLLALGLAAALPAAQGELMARIAGALAGGGGLFIVRWAYRLATRRDGLGLGDVKLFAAAGAWVGVEGLPQVLLIASLLGLICAAFSARPPETGFAHRKIPFGPGLCIAFWLTWLYGPFISHF